MKYLMLVLLFGSLSACVSDARNTKNEDIKIKILSDNKLNVTINNKQMELIAVSPEIIRVRYGDLTTKSAKLDYLQNFKEKVEVKTAETNTDYIFATGKVELKVSKKTGAIVFLDAVTKKIILAETANSLKPVEKYGIKTYEISSSFEMTPDELVSGSGFQQDKIVNFNGRYALFLQGNNNGTLPFFQSNKNWAILWNNSSLTKLNPQFLKTVMASNDKKESSYQFIAPESGEYYFSVSKLENKKYGKLYLAIGKNVILSKYPAWDPNVFTSTINLKKGETYKIRALGNFNVNYVLPSIKGKMTFQSELGECIDYHFVYAKSADERISAYRNLTGRAPMFPKWTSGFFQCKERYRSAGELLSIVARFRKNKYPIDSIVQDWQYWGKYGWNAVRFDKARFDKMEDVIENLHKDHVQLMISVWPNFGDPKNGCKENLENFKKKGFMLESIDKSKPLLNKSKFNANFYDAYNPEAGKALWTMMNDNMFSIGMDAWWLDATEPNIDAQLGGIRKCNTCRGPGALYANLYPLVHSINIYDNQRKTSNKKRVFILARTPSTGIQHYGTAVWSGDTWTSWDTMIRQIAAGITTSYSGIPYWCSDTGGFCGLNNKKKEHRELYTRWFQFSTFCPIFRAHGTSCAREPWHFGKNQRLLKFVF